MLKHLVFGLEFDVVQPSYGDLVRVVYPSVLSVTVTVLANIEHFCIIMRELRHFWVSAGQWLKRLGDLSHVTFSVRAKWENSQQTES
jgi:hypothetical protein